MTGLRRSELDRLQWGHIDFARDTLMVQSTADGTVKGTGSTRQVGLPEDLTATLEAWKKAATWLRTKFLPGEHHPLHTLRKEYGSLIAQHAGIHAAADLLGHCDIRTASEYYVVRKTRAFTGLQVAQSPRLSRTPDPKGNPPRRRGAPRCSARPEDPFPGLHHASRCHKTSWRGGTSPYCPYIRKPDRLPCLSPLQPPENA